MPRSSRRSLPFVLRPAWEILRAPFTRRTWAEVAYLVVGLPFAGLALVAGGPLLLGAPLLVAVVGMPLVAGTLAGARWLAGVQREVAAVLLRERVDAPRPVEHEPGLAGWLRGMLHDQVAWRSIGYFAAKLPLALIGNYALVFMVTGGWYDVMYPAVWERPGPGHLHDDTPFTFVTVETRGGTWLVAAIGVGLLLLAPWAVRGVVAVDRHLVRRLLGPVTLTERVRVLEETRAQAIDRSTAQLRQIERDLHDGAQIRLAALAMTLGQIKEDLDVEAPTGGEHTRALVDQAHRNAKEALVELRDLVRGIHPPVLDTGLDAALATLAATSALPVTVAVDLPERPSPPIEAIAYFCAAELLANAARHSQGERIVVEAAGHGGRLRLTVTDDGSGRAEIRAGGGLAGLVERARTVDGTVRIDSPPGGPTVVAVDLPLRAGEAAR